MRVLILACVLALGLATGANAQASRYDLWAANGQNQIQARLRDPGSARFGRVVVSMYQGAPIVCGNVNSRNGLGGYAGNQRFIWAGSRISVLEEEMAAGEMDSLWRDACRNVVHVARP